MSEIKSYGFLIGTEECWRRRNEILFDINKCKGFLAITPEPNGLGQILLFDTLDNRNKAMKMFKGIYQTIRKIPVEIYFDDKYLTEEGKATPEEILGEDEFGKMMQEIIKSTEKKAKEEAKKECESKIKSANAQVSLWKGKVSELEQNNLRLTLQIKNEKEAKAEMRSNYEKTIKALNKEIKSLEADLKRMEKENFNDRVTK